MGDQTAEGRPEAVRHSHRSADAVDASSAALSVVLGFRALRYSTNVTASTMRDLDDWRGHKPASPMIERVFYTGAGGDEPAEERRVATTPVLVARVGSLRSQQCRPFARADSRLAPDWSSLVGLGGVDRGRQQSEPSPHPAGMASGGTIAACDERSQHLE